MDIKDFSRFDLKPVMFENIKEYKLDDPKSETRRLTYASGFYFSLVLALYYEEAGRPDLSSDFKPYLTSFHNPPPSGVDLARKIFSLSNEKIAFDSKHIPNPGLRYGRYGHFYVKGTRDCFDLCFEIIPGMIMEGSRGKNRSLVLEWINKQMQDLNPLPDGLKLKYVNN